jgi:hypothetical protein
MNGTFPDTSGIRSYNVYHVPAGFGVMFGAGALSGLLGIGSGALKVVAMDQAIRDAGRQQVQVRRRHTARVMADPSHAGFLEDGARDVPAARAAASL